MNIRWAIFVSGEGSNLQNLLDIEKSGKFLVNRLAAVHADRKCRGIERAEEFEKPSLVLSPNHPEHTSKLLNFLNEHAIDRIFLLGYMRLLKKDFLEAWKKPILNLHPSLLPKYPGLNAVHQALKANDKALGVTLHNVIEEVDAGSLIRQVSFPRPASTDLQKIMEEVHAFERSIVSDYFFDLERDAALV